MASMYFKLNLNSWRTKILRLIDIYFSLLLDLCKFNTIYVTKQDDFCIFRQRKPDGYCWPMNLLYGRQPLNVCIFYLIFIRIHFDKGKRKRLYFLGGAEITHIKGHPCAIFKPPHLQITTNRLYSSFA